MLRIGETGVRRRFGPLALVDVLMLAGLTAFLMALAVVSQAESRATLSSAFERRILAPSPAEALFNLHMFLPAATDSPGGHVSQVSSDPARRFVIRTGSHRQVSRWPFGSPPFHGSPNALALTPDGRKLYVTVPGREGDPDWRVAVVNAASRDVDRWIDVRPIGQLLGTRPIAVAVSPPNAEVSPQPYLVVLNEYGNFASVVDIGTDTIIGEFQTEFYAEDLVFNCAGTRLYVSDRFGDHVCVFRIERGPFFTEIATVPTRMIELDGANPGDFDLRAPTAHSM